MNCDFAYLRSDNILIARIHILSFISAVHPGRRNRHCRWRFAMRGDVQPFPDRLLRFDINGYTNIRDGGDALTKCKFSIGIGAGIGMLLGIVIGTVLDAQMKNKK